MVTLRPSMTLAEAFDAALTGAGDTALTADGERAALRELDVRARALAARLYRNRVRAGDHVGVLLPNGIRYAEALLAVVRLGGVLVPLDPELPVSDLETLTRTLPLRATLSDHSLPASGRLDVIATQAGGWSGLDAAPGTPPSGGFAARRREDPGAVFLTSGTTGHPKPVVLTHHQLVQPVIALGRLQRAFFSGTALERVRSLGTVGRRHGTRLLRAAGRQTWLTTSPFRSMAGHQVLMGALLLGHDLVTAPSFHPRRTLELLDEHRVNVLAGTPATLELLLRIKDFSPYDLSSLLIIGVGGGPAAPDLVERARERFGCAVTVGYGSTELGGGVLSTRLEDPLRAQAETVGRPFPGTEIRVVGEAGADAPAGAAGELLCRPPGASAWLRTGDLASLGPDGNVRILGRKDDLIVRGAQNVHPVEIERVVEELPSVGRCAVVAVPAHGDQQVWAFVTAADGQIPSAEEVHRHCRASLVPSKRPDRVRVLEGLPTNELGEVLKRELRDRAAAEVAR
jgi:acyl-CoA synthetase (AMP-forming)/AMP-acid ligase II